ncbi:MAG: CopG family transcriptional regulator [Thermoplasmata archaeon]|nr:MAG: CopG family transcriptional regulator [Thermoplasmata archaeon]
MVESKRVTIRLSEEMLGKIASLVSSGEYKTVSDVIRDALQRFLDERESPPNISRVTVELPRGNVIRLEQLVSEGDAISIGDAIRDAVREYIRRKMKSE